MEKLIEIIKNFDFKNENHFREFNNELRKLTHFPIVLQKTIEKGRKIYRSRRNENTDSIYFFENEISYRRDVNNITQIGRCNLKNSSKFYGAIKNNQIEYGYIVCMTEASDLFRNNQSGIETFTTGMWNVEEDINALVIIPNIENLEMSKLNSELIDAYNHIQNKEIFNDCHIELNKLLGKEFSKEVKIGNEIEYYISAIFSESLLAQTNYVDAILYPSVQTKYEGFNIVMNTEKADKHLKLERVIIDDLIKINDTAMLNHIFTAELTAGQPFLWQPIERKYFSSKEEIKKIFLEKDTLLSESIIDAFFDQYL